MTEAERLVEQLRLHGWTVVGQRTGLYVRLAWPAGVGHRRSSLVVPVDQTAADYPELMDAALTELDNARVVGLAVAKVLEAISNSADERS